MDSRMNANTHAHTHTHTHTLANTQWCHHGLKNLDVLERVPNTGHAALVKLDVGKFGIRAINTLQLSYPEPKGSQV